MLRRLQRRYPGVEVTVVTGNSVDIAAAVVANRLDVAVVTLPVTSRDLTIAPFCVDPLVAIAPTSSPLAGRRAVTPRELAQERLIVYERGGTIRKIVEEWFRRVDLAPRVAMELGNAEAIKRLVSAGLGLAVTSAVSAQDEVRRGKLAAIPLRPALHRRLGIIRRRDKPISPALQAVLGVLAPPRRRKLDEAPRTAQNRDQARTPCTTSGSRPTATSTCPGCRRPVHVEGVARDEGPHAVRHRRPRRAEVDVQERRHRSA